MYKYTPKPAKLTEIRQEIDIRFAFVKEKGNELIPITPEVKCRDYFNDLVIANVYKNPKFIVNIYGFTYSWSPETEVDSDYTKLVVCFPSISVRDIFIANFHYLTDIEDQNNFVKTSYELIDAANLRYYFKADKVWQKTTYLISLYTYLIRWLCYKVLENENMFQELSVIDSVGPDISSLNYYYYSVNGFDKYKIQYKTFLTNLVKKIPVVEYDMSLKTSQFDVEIIHNYSGIRNLPNPRLSYCCSVLGKHKQFFRDLIDEMLEL